MRPVLDEQSGRHAPRPRPPVAVTLLISDPSREPLAGCRSSRYAPSTPSAAPVAKPCTIRAANSAATPCASQKTPIAAASTTSATASTGRRPRKSDSRPTVSRLVSNAST